MISGVPAHNNRIDYWLTLNPQRIALAMKVGTPVYESCYVGKCLPYGRPGTYPMPLVVGGMLDGVPATRFSDTTHSVWVKGGRPNMRLRFNDGAWRQPSAYPWNNTYLAGATTQVRDTGGEYPLERIVLSDSISGIFGELDGVFQISGFNNATENTLTIAGDDYVVFQDTWRTGFIDYYAMRMDS